MEPNKQRLILSIINFLQDEAEHTTADKRESIEVAMQCLESAFDVEYGRDRGKFPDLENLMSLFCCNNTEKALEEAEEAKNKGNELMRGGMYQEAVEQYSRAINLNPNNAVYFCNRAAAYSRLENHENAIADCEEAVRLDPRYAKAYGRLGIAYSSLNRFREAKDAYMKALSADPGNTMYEENLKLADERLLSNPLDSGDIPDPANVDLGQFMNNPNLLNMASQMLNDPGVRNVMSGILHMGNDGRNANIDALLQMGQQLAQQMQINNPAFVDDLRRQFSGEGTSAEETNDLSNPNSDKKDEPPGSTHDGDASA